MAVYDRIAVDTAPEIKQMLLELCRQDDRNMRQMVSYLIRKEYEKRQGVNEKVVQVKM